MLDGWFCRTVANQKSMDQIDQEEDAQSDSQEGKFCLCPLIYFIVFSMNAETASITAIRFLHSIDDKVASTSTTYPTKLIEFSLYADRLIELYHRILHSGTKSNLVSYTCKNWKSLRTV